MDASALVRGLWIVSDSQARRWLVAARRGAVEGVVPDVAYAEVANSLLVQHRARVLELAQVRRMLVQLLSLPLAVRSLSELVLDAAATAAARDLSVYDACYLVLAESLDAVLVTADRRLAAATDRAVLLT